MSKILYNDTIVFELNPPVKEYNLNFKHTPGNNAKVTKYNTDVNIFTSKSNFVNSKNDICLGLVYLYCSSSFNIKFSASFSLIFPYSPDKSNFYSK